MLYRPAPSSSFRVRAALIVRKIAAGLASLAQRRADANYLDGLGEHGLRDLGLRRVETRDGARYY
ncbi:MAG: hypothetical protein ABI697_08400 [Devosia sp.]